MTIFHEKNIYVKIWLNKKCFYICSHKQTTMKTLEIEKIDIAKKIAMIEVNMNHYININSINKRFDINNSNSYTHSDSEIKDLPRTILFETTVKKFSPDKVKTLRTVSLGGEKLSIENKFINHYKLKGLSYEKEAKTIAIAEKNKPKGINIIKDNIFKHKYNNEHFIWFDFTSYLTYKNLNDLFSWVNDNTIKNDCIFCVTYSLGNRKKGEGYRQLFKTNEDIDVYVSEMANYIALFLENENVKLNESISIIKYKNIDTGAKTDMVQITFDLTKK